MASRKRTYKRYRREKETVRTVADLAGYVSGEGMPAALSGITFRIEIRSAQVVTVAEHRYLLR